MRWGPRFEVPKVIVLFRELKQERSRDVRGNESTTLSLLTGLPPSFSANVNAGSLGAWPSAASDLGNSEPASSRGKWSQHWAALQGMCLLLRPQWPRTGQEDGPTKGCQVSWCVQCCCGDQIWKSRISLGGPGWSRPSCAPHGNV